MKYETQMPRIALTLFKHETQMPRIALTLFKHENGHLNNKGTLLPLC